MKNIIYPNRAFIVSLTLLVLSLSLARCNIGGDWLAVDGAEGVPPVPGAPPVPANLRSDQGANSWNGEYRLAWDAVRGSGILYELQGRSRISTASFSELQNDALTSIDITGQAEGQYEYRVRACTSEMPPLCSAWSGIHIVSVLPACIATPVTSRPANGYRSIAIFAHPAGDPGVNLMGGTSGSFATYEGTGNSSVAAWFRSVTATDPPPLPQGWNAMCLDRRERIMSSTAAATNFNNLLSSYNTNTSYIYSATAARSLRELFMCSANGLGLSEADIVNQGLPIYFVRRAGGNTYTLDQATDNLTIVDLYLHETSTPAPAVLNPRVAANMRSSYGADHIAWFFVDPADGDSYPANNNANCQNSTDRNNNFTGNVLEINSSGGSYGSSRACGNPLPSAPTARDHRDLYCVTAELNAPPAPTGLTSDETNNFSTDGMFRLSWNAASGATSYNWRRRGGPTRTVTATTATEDVTGLAMFGRGEHVYEVRACINSTLCSGWSNELRVTVFRLPCARAPGDGSSSRPGSGYRSIAIFEHEDPTGSLIGDSFTTTANGVDWDGVCREYPASTLAPAQMALNNVLAPNYALTNAYFYSATPGRTLEGLFICDENGLDLSATEAFDSAMTNPVPIYFVDKSAMPYTLVPATGGLTIEDLYTHSTGGGGRGNLNATLTSNLRATYSGTLGPGTTTIGGMAVPIQRAITAWFFVNPADSDTYSTVNCMDGTSAVGTVNGALFSITGGNSPLVGQYGITNFTGYSLTQCNGSKKVYCVVGEAN